MRIEEAATQVRLKYVELHNMGVSGKASRSLSLQVKAKKELVQGLLSLYYTWMCLGTRATIDSVTITPEQVSAMYYEGQMPWAAVGTGTALHFGKEYHQLVTDLSRCEEELIILSVEGERLQAWLQRGIALISESLVGLQCEQPILTQDVVQAQLQGLFGSGRAFFLLQHKQHMQSMLDRVQELGV